MDDTDLGTLFDRYADALYRHALVFVRQDADAEDIVQSVFVKLARRLRRAGKASGPSIHDFEAYLHRAVRNESLSLVRSRRLVSDGQLALVVARNGAPAAEVERIQAALSSLPAEQCEVVVFHVYEGQSFRRIGELLGVPQDTAASRYRYAREKLKRLLADDADDEG